MTQAEAEEVARDGSLEGFVQLETAGGGLEIGVGLRPTWPAAAWGWPSRRWRSSSRDMRR